LRGWQRSIRAKGLIDTGAFLALIDNKDRWHERCVQVYQALDVPLATSAAVLTELFYLAGIRLGRQDAAWGLLGSGAVTVLPIDDADLPALEQLMRKHADRPMDFADATLVHLARREQLNVVFTIDHDDFETYRIDGRGPFRIVPDR
jgi:predicted nucleic acid-binding protein